MKKSTIALEQELFASIPIVINYKDDIFMRAFSGYGECSKKDITETDLKRDILARENGKDILSNLEQQYVEKKSRDAINCDDLLSDTFKDALADAYNAFYDEVIKIIKKLPSTDKQFEKDNNTIKSRSPRRLIERAQGSKNLCLVYQNGSDGVFQYETLENLLDTIAKVSVCYCLGLDNFDALPVDLQDSKTSKEVTTPMFIRNICVLTCYTILNLGKFAFIKYRHTQLPKGTGVCSQIMHELHERSKALGYECFIKEDKLFQSDKWSMSPVYMVESMSYVPPKMPFAYSGMKEGYLGYLISELQKQVPYKKFIDVFGGSGAASVQFRHREDAEYYINDYDYRIVSYYRIMQTTSLADLNEFYDKFYILNSLYLDAIDAAFTIFDQKWNKTCLADDNYAAAIEFARNEFFIFSNPIFDLYEDFADSSKCRVLCNTKLKNHIELIDAIGYLTGKDILGYLKKYNIKGVTSYGNRTFSYIDAAVLFAFYAAHPVNGGISRYVFSEDNTTLSRGDIKERKDVVKLFSSLRESFSSIVINNNGASAMDILNDTAVKESELKDVLFNTEDTLVYSDSPYIGTMGYTINQVEKVENIAKPKDITKENVGEKFYCADDFDMSELLDRYFSFKGKIIFSCRINMTASDIKEGLLVEKPDDKMGYNKKRFFLNNYIWFWNKWLKRENDYVVFLYDKDYIADNNIENKYKSLSLSFPALNCNVIKYLVDKIFNGEDLEIMITNFDYILPDFNSFYEIGKIGNIHGKKTDPIKLVPKNGEFIKMPVKQMAEIVLQVMQFYVNRM